VLVTTIKFIDGPQEVVPILVRPQRANFFAFVLRAIRRVLADQSQTDRQVIASLWSIFDDPDLNGALDIPQKSPIAIVPRKAK
jgi:hypothetical protein